MVWRLCKIFRIKPTDEFFTGMTAVEQAWFFTMASQDVQDEYDERLAFVEYLASFSNPEAVKQIRETRKNARPQTDEEFAQMLGSQFGRAAAFRAKK